MGRRGRAKERVRGERKLGSESRDAFAARIEQRRKREAENARRRAARAAKKRGEG